MPAVELSKLRFATDANLRAYWKLEDLNDSSGNAVTLTNNNTVAFNSAFFANGGDGGSGNTNKFLSTTNTLSIDGGAISCSSWVKITGATFPMIFWQQSNNTSKTTYRIYADNANSIIFQRANFGGTSTDLTVSYTPGTSNFHHYVLTYDGTTLKSYIDGVFQQQGAASGTGSSAITEGVKLLSNESGGLVLQGIIDDCAIFNRELSASEVSTIFNSQNTGYLTTNSKFW